MHAVVRHPVGVIISMKAVNHGVDALLYIITQFLGFVAGFLNNISVLNYLVQRKNRRNPYIRHGWTGVENEDWRSILDGGDDKYIH